MSDQSFYEASGVFCGGVFTEKEVTDILAEAKTVFLKDGGSQIIQWGSQGNSAINRIDLTASQVIEECKMALRELNPDAYPPEVDRTQAGFSR